MRRCQPSPPSVPSLTLPQLCQGTGRGQPQGPQRCWANWGHPSHELSLLWQEQELCARGKLPLREAQILIRVVEGSTESFVPPCPPPAGAQHRIHFSSAVSTRLLVVGKVSNRTGKAMNSLKHKQVLLILVQAVSLAQGPLGLAQVLCTFMTDPLDWRD